ncbi:hypothetical protein BH10PSE5_BH10PSE5_01430 [soil metagenome]
MSGLPKLLAEVEKAAGVGVALKLAQDHGGTQISLSAAKGSVLTKSVGQAAAALIVKALGHGRVVVPMATARGQRGRRAAAAEMLAKGATINEVVSALDVHNRTAWRIKAKAKEEPAKRWDLFGKD